VLTMCVPAAGEGFVQSSGRAFLNPLSLTLSPLLRRGERVPSASFGGGIKKFSVRMAGRIFLGRPAGFGDR